MEQTNLPKSPQNQSLMRFSDLTKSSPILQLIRAKQPALTSEICQSLTIAKAQQGVSLSLMRSQCGALVTEAQVSVLLSEALKFFNHTVSNDDIAIYARKVCLDYYFWKLEDVALCLNNGIAGRYGHSIARWTYGDTFVTWAEGYEKDRIEWTVENNVNRKREIELLKPDEDSALKPIFCKEIVEKMSAPKPKEVVTHNVQTRERNKADELIDEFEALNHKQNNQRSSLGLVTYLKRKMDLQEYITIRNDETKL